MDVQSDEKVRVVSLSNLHAMCKYVSGECHRFNVANVTRSRVYVQYSNPDEYGVDHPFDAVFPIIPGYEADNPQIVLQFIRTQGEPSNMFGEGWQCFQVLLDCPTLWRDPRTGFWEPVKH